MSLDTLPESVRQSELARALDEKLKSQQPVDFDYWGEFKRLREVVSAQTGEMKVLFPEFTPHDETHHLARLFGIADKMLGTQRYKQMNAAELFLLACGLYAHDWGMAVGNEELDFLRSWATGDANKEIFTPLDDEEQLLRQFLESRGIRASDSKDLPQILDEELQLYVRKTHAWRSGVRARAFFQTIGSSVPQALEKVCQGHWLDFSELDDEFHFSSRLGVLGHTVNLRAIALYVRLIDLFDIADDRTPYAVWKFVAPRDEIAKMEWEKHRALSPVTFPEHGDGRCARFDSTTADPEVWAELEDLRHYCNEQISGTMDLLARHDDERHRLDLRRLDWNVTAERFKPVNIRFEFHRQRMFEILADEIYQGDSYVFLRELLQNSIDAIRMRRELVLRKASKSGRKSNFGLGFDDAIYFDVQHGENGDVIVSCKDSGIGMDEYIVRNYLSMAGVSYYRSSEFKNLGLEMDPISRFGIGILSCFMVADHIEIVTCREAQIADRTEPLHINIPAVTRQFRIYPANGDFEIGTNVKVHVLGKKLKADVTENEDAASKGPSSQLQVSEYLCAIAGFVEFPIVVDEGGLRTVILHPDRPETDAEEFQIDDSPLSVRQLSSEYGWEEGFAPQDVSIARQHLRQQTYDVRNDLGLTDYEGTVTYIRPTLEKVKFDKEYGDGSYETMVLSTEEGTPVTIRQTSNYGTRYLQKTGLSPSCRTNHLHSVYRDGILVADVTLSERDNWFTYARMQWPAPALRINLPRNISGTPDVARRMLLGAKASWDAPIWQAAANHLKDNSFAEVLECDAHTRLLGLAKLAVIYHFTQEEMVNFVPYTQWPLPMLYPNQGTGIKDNQLEAGKTIYQTPTFLVSYVALSLGWGGLFTSRLDLDVLNKWEGNPSFTLNTSFNHSPLLEIWMSMSEWFLKRTLAPIKVLFLRPPYPGLPPLQQVEFQCVEKTEINEDELIEKIIADPASLDPNCLCAMRSLWWEHHLKPIIDATPFEPPYESFFIGDDKILNLRHTTSIALLRCCAAIRKHKKQKSIAPANIGLIEDRLKQVADNLHAKNLQRLLKRLWETVKEINLLELGEVPPLRDTDYAPVSKDESYIQKALEHDSEEKEEFKKLTDKYLRPFGQPLDEILFEEVPTEIVERMSKRK